MGELQRIRGFLDDVRRRLLWREALTWGAAGGAALLTVLLLLALSAARVGPGSFWRPVTTLAALACAAVAVGFGVWRPRRSLRSAPQTARLVARLDPNLRALSGDIISAIEFGEARFSESSFGEAALGDVELGDARLGDPDSLGNTPGATAQVPAAQTPRGASWFGSTLSRPPRRAAAPAPLLTSPALARAFQGTVADALRPFSAAGLVPFRPAIQSGATLLLAIAILVGLTLASPEGVRRGLTLLLHRPSLFEGSLVSAVPMVGDVRITYEYPPYTGLPARIVEGSTGDVVAVRGTRVTIETAPLHTSRRAALLMGESGDGPEVPVHLAKGIITAHLTLHESGNYRFWLQPLIGRALREERSHRIEVETDRPPRIEIQGPADRLELASPRPVEIGYSASDDFGLGAIDLVYRIDETPEQRLPLKDAHGARSAQGRLLWNPARDNLLSVGARVAYHIEARDGDQVSGAKVGLSRTLYITIARPQESADDRLDRQREILENLTGDLADRLEVPAPGAGRSPTSSPVTGAGVGAAATSVSAPPASMDSRWSAILAAHEAEEAHITLLGRLLDDDRRQGILGKALRNQLAAIAERLGKLLRDERAVIAKSTAPGRGFPQRGVAAASPRHSMPALAQLSRQQPAHVAELEKDVLLIDDLVGRQRLEELASIGRELTDSHKRLEDLLSRYAATRDEALKRQLERELRELRARIADLAQKIANLKSRNEVSDEWRNMPDTRAIAERARKLDELLGQGDPSAISKALSELGRDLRGLRQMLDENAEGFGEERFPQENRVISDLMKRIGDLEGDERSLAGETKGLSDKQEAEIERRLHGQLAEWTRKETEKVEQLRQALGEIRTGDPESPLTEEVERARESAKQLRRLLGERDLAEAKGEADRAAQSLERATGLAELAAAAQRKKKGSDGKQDKQNKQDKQDGKSEIAESLSGARGLAREIADEVQQFLPKPEETLGPSERDSARGQADRQSVIGDRADDAAREAGRRLGQVPGLEQAQDDLRAATEQMRQAATHLRKSEAKQAGSAERNAAERLAKLRDSLQERSMGGAKQQRDPVRIPGADESSAPRAWRQELLDAMKEHAPEHFRDDVRRYYEELVK